MAAQNTERMINIVILVPTSSVANSTLHKLNCSGSSHNAIAFSSRNFDDTYQICILCQCLVDRVFRNCGVCNSEVLLYWCTKNL